MHLCARSWIAWLSCLVWLAGCAAPEEVDWRNRTDTLEMRAPVGRDAVGVLTVAGRVDATVFTDDALWALVAVPTRRGLPVNRLIRIDLATNRFRDLFAVDGFSFGSLAVGHGSIWVVEGLGGNKLHRVDPVSQRIVASIATSGNPVGVTVSDKAIWVLGNAPPSRLGGVVLKVEGLVLSRIDPATQRIEQQIPIPLSKTLVQGVHTAASITTAGGSVWVVTPAGEVVRVDPTNNQIVTTLTVPDDGVARQAIYRFMTVGEKLYLMRQVKAKASLYPGAESMRTTLWTLNTHHSRFDGEPVELGGKGLVVSQGPDGLWFGSTRADAILRATGATTGATFARGPESWHIGYPVYALASGQGTLWAYSGAGITQGDDRNITWITRLSVTPP